MTAAIYIASVAKPSIPSAKRMKGTAKASSTAVLAAGGVRVFTRQRMKKESLDSTRYDNGESAKGYMVDGLNPSYDPVIGTSCYLF